MCYLFNNACENPTHINIFNACFRFVCSPGLVLAKLFQAVDHDNVNRSTVEIALNKIQRGHEKKALKLLCSNGVADVDEQTVDELRNMHPELKEPLILPKPSTSQLSIDLPTIRKKLYDDAAKRDISKDVYGWTPSLFYQERAKSDGFLDSLARFGAFLVDNTQAFPPICATLLSAGYLTPLHKLTPQEREERSIAGLPVKLRPINSGSMLTKAVLELCSKPPQLKGPKSNCRPSNLPWARPEELRD
jgi:hypothetical protein